MEFPTVYYVTSSVHVKTSLTAVMCKAADLAGNKILFLLYKEYFDI